MRCECVCVCVCVCGGGGGGRGWVEGSWVQIYIHDFLETQDKLIR